MASINSFPNNQDVYIGAEPVMRWLHGRTSGVFGGDGNLAVEAVQDEYAVTVNDGTGWMSNNNADGVVFWVDNVEKYNSKLKLQPEIADPLRPRVDRVVVTWETTDYVALPTVTILKGAAASSPQPPALTNNALQRQISLARISIPAGATSITGAMITDERLDETVCGIVTGTIEFDTTVMQAQFEELLQAIRDEMDDIDSEWDAQQGSINSDYANWKAQTQADYNRWFNQIKGTLDDDPAGQLAQEVAELQNRDDVIFTYRHVKNGTMHTFIGSGSNGKVKMTADVESGDTVNISWMPQQEMTIEGETSQPGTGDPSPENIRMISGVGAYDQCVVLDGSEDWVDRSEVTENIFSATVNTLPLGGTTIAKNDIKASTAKVVPTAGITTVGNDITEKDLGCVNTSSTRGITFYLKRPSISVEEVKDELSHHPLIVWYRSVDFYKSKGPFYTVVELSDAPYRAVGFELNQPLFDGDSLKVGGKSGCDQMIVLDGTENWLRRDNNTYYAHLIDAQIAAVGSDKIQYSSSKYLWSPNHPNASNRFNISEGAAVLYIVDKDVDDIPAFKQQLSDWASAGTPLTIFYRSVNYTPDKDIPVALEKRANGYYVTDGNENWLFGNINDNNVYVYDTEEGGKNPGGSYFVSSHFKKPNVLLSPINVSNYTNFACGSENDFPRITIAHDVLGTTAASVNGATKAKSYFAAQYSAGTPVTIVYELATPVTYAHLAQPETLPVYYGFEEFVDAIAGEDVTGRWLTFTNDGEQLNFKGGGGIGVSKLAATTALPADVISGKTFYSKDKTLKTGTLADKPALNDAVSVGNDGSYLYVRIPVGAYRTRQATGYPEVRFPNAEAIKNIPGGDKGDWSGTYSGSDVTIPQGYHAGGGKVGVAGGNRGAWNGTYSGSNVTIPQGYHSGGGSVGVAGGNRGSWGSTIDPGGSVTIPKGYHSGGGKVTANKTQPNVFAVGKISYISYADPPASGTTFNGSYIRVEVVPNTYAEAFCQIEGWYCVWYGGLPGDPFFYHCDVGYSFGRRDSGQGGDILIARVEW